MDLSHLLTELRFSTSRSGGKGGQNVNKVESRVTLYFHVRESQLLLPEQKEKLREKLATRLTDDGELQLSCEAERSQLLNKRACMDKFFRLLEKALLPEKERRENPPHSCLQGKANAGKAAAGGAEGRSVFSR